MQKQPQGLLLLSVLKFQSIDKLLVLGLMHAGNSAANLPDRYFFRIRGTAPLFRDDLVQLEDDLNKYDIYRTRATPPTHIESCMNCEYKLSASERNH